MSFKPIADAAAFLGTVVLGETPETRVLEFKAEYRWQKDKYKPGEMANQAEELCRDVAQFANSEGGTVLVGVTERSVPEGRKVADAIQPVVNVDGFKQWTEQAIRNHLAPSTFSRSLDTIVLPQGVVLAINVLPSLHLVALWHADRKNGIEYLYRTDHGKQWMNPDEVERHIMNGSRAMQIQLARVFDDVGRAGSNLPVELTPQLKAWDESRVEAGVESMGRLVSADHDVSVNPALCSDREIELRINLEGRAVCVRLPHGLVGEAWTTSDRRVGLCLKVAIVIRGDRDIGLEPLGSLP
jgi:schlafen family protein